MAIGQSVHKLWIYGEFMCKMTTYMQGTIKIIIIIIMAVMVLMLLLLMMMMMMMMTVMAEEHFGFENIDRT